MSQSPPLVAPLSPAAELLSLRRQQASSLRQGHHLNDKPVKDIYVYPLDPNFRNVLTAPLP